MRKEFFPAHFIEIKKPLFLLLLKPRGTPCQAKKEPCEKRALKMPEEDIPSRDLFE
jgi:hypothetical protein